jgi:hypothetical protein
MQGPAECHDHIADALFPQADAVFDDATALHTAVDMLNPEPAVVSCLVGQLLLSWQSPAAWCLQGHEDVHLGQCERQKAQFLQQPTAGRQGIRGGLGNPLVMHAAAVGLTQEDSRSRG